MEVLEPPSLGYGGAMYAATLTGNYTVSDSNDPAIMSPLLLDLLPSGAERDVEFPRPGQPLEGRVQYVRNNAAAGGYTLRIRSGTSASATLGTISTLQPMESCICVYRQDPADDIWKLYTLSLGYAPTALAALTLSGLLTTNAGITNNSTLDQNGNIDHDTTQTGSGAGLDTLAQVSSATGSPDAVVVGLTQITNNRTAGTATAVDITVTGRAGDGAGGNYEIIRGTPVSNGGSATFIWGKIVAGFTRFLDLSEAATGEGNVMLADNLADAFSIRQASTYLMKVVTTTGSRIVQFAQGIGADTIAEVTSAAGVTVDGCLIKDGRVAALATTSQTMSAEQTGTGAPQTVAHSIGSTPTIVQVIPTDTTSGWVVSGMSVDGTNVTVTVTLGAKFRVYSYK